MSSHCVALIGSPNSGKTTLYNWLTGSRSKTVNYPGATVEYSLGPLASHWGEGPTVMDTPGTYSLFPKSADEEVTLKALLEHPSLSSALVVVDGTQIERHLQLALQVRETGVPFAVVITMSDLLRSQGIELDLHALESELGVPVRAIDGLLGAGLREVIELLRGLPTERPLAVAPRAERLKAHQAEAQRLAVKMLQKTPHPEVRWARLAARTRRWDRVLLHPLLGPVLFFLIMTALFSSIYWLAAPFMDWIDGGFAGTAEFIRARGPEGLITEFIADGVVAGLGAILVFVPQIFILFVGIGLLEGSGYLARAATLIDRPFSKIGLSGRAFVPILSGFSCAVPALMATRNISSARDRAITQFIVPLMACSARLPVYALLLAFLFPLASPWKAGLALAGLYLGAVVVGALAAAILNRLLPKDKASLLMMELPLYRRPRLSVVVRQALHRTGAYVKQAGPIIFVIAGLMWFGTNFPRNEEQSGSERLEQSYAGRMGHFIEPVFAPMGIDWRVGVGLMTAFAAREVFVATLAVTFNVAAEDETEQTSSLLEKMSSATRGSDGHRVFTPGSVAGLLVFFMIAMQCMSTFAIARRESGSWKFAITQLVAFNVVAYVLAVAVYQSFAAFGLG